MTGQREEYKVGGDRTLVAVSSLEMQSEDS